MTERPSSAAPRSRLQKVLTWTEIQERAAAFVKRWRGYSSERAEAQTFWNEFFHIFGRDRLAVGRFEAKAERYSTGREGRIDLLWPKVIVAEHKSRGADLEKAAKQLFDYDIPITETPQLYVVSDFERFVVHDVESGEAIDFELEDLAKHARIFAPLAGYQRRAFRQEEKASEEAAELLGKLYDHLEKNHYGGHELRILIVRILFCVFADDTNVWRKGLFEEFIEYRTTHDGSDLGPQLMLLFQILNRPNDKRQTSLDEDLSSFPYIDGGLFEETIPVPMFDRTGRELLLKASAFDWSSVSPIVFGSLFQSVQDKGQRRNLGGHYTAEESILKLVRPLFLDELREELNRVRRSKPKLKELHAKIARLRFFDPACGCGNFLAVAYRELRRLETDLLVALHSRAGHVQQVTDIAHLARVSVDQFYGIEIEEFPARIAQTAMFLVDHLENVALAAKFGLYFARFPIEEESHIHIADALELPWDDVLPADACSYLMGNPPYAGQVTRSASQTAAMKRIWGSAYRRQLDYVSCWFLLGFRYVEHGEARAAFVATNSISQGEQVATVWQPMLDAGIEIDFAHRTFKWTSEARGKAAVHVVIVGFSLAGSKKRKALFDYADVQSEPVERVAKHINPYLVEYEDVLVERASKPLSPAMSECRYGNKPSDNGHLIVEPRERPSNDPIANKYLRRYVGAKELLHGNKRWCLWLVNAPPHDIQGSKFIKDRVAKVREYRASSSAKDTRKAAEQPQRFFRTPQPSVRYIAIPTTVSARRRWFTVEHLDANTIASNALFTAIDPDGFLFGVLSSKMWIAWLRTVGGQLKSDLRVSKDVVYNTFPLPVPTDSQRKRIVKAGEAVRAARRKFPGSSLADLYDPLSLPAPLLKAHRKLDQAVDRLFGFKGLSDADRLRTLFAAYASMQPALPYGSKNRGRRPG